MNASKKTNQTSTKPIVAEGGAPQIRLDDLEAMGEVKGGAAPPARTLVNNEAAPPEMPIVRTFIVC